jgi:3-methyladenine DNA glycosylase AlkD
VKYFTPAQISNAIKTRIAALGKPEKAAWLENYVKHSIKSKGVGIPDIREIVKKTADEFNLAEIPLEDQAATIRRLFESTYTEDKLASILFLQLYRCGNYDREILELLSGVLDDKLIADWNVCDWLGVRVISPIIDCHKEKAIEVLSDWNRDDYLWKARLSLVPFAGVQNIDDYQETIYEFSERLIKREERFAKTAVGWILREFSKHDSEFVDDFLQKFSEYSTKEVERNALKYKQ